MNARLVLAPETANLLRLCGIDPDADKFNGASMPGRPERTDRALSFTLRCIPTAQQRPRHMRTKNGIDLTYKSRSQKDNERTLEALLMPYTPVEPLEEGIELRFRAIMPVPPSASKKRSEAMLRGSIGHTAKPDLDNLAKQLKDAMTRLRFWHDDRQVVRLVAEKLYGRNPCWQVSARQITRGMR